MAVYAGRLAWQWGNRPARLTARFARCLACAFSSVLPAYCPAESARQVAGLAGPFCTCLLLDFTSFATSRATLVVQTPASAASRRAMAVSIGTGDCAYRTICAYTQPD